jgi:tetratricopeptide (TPR) repeat protein
MRRLILCLLLVAALPSLLAAQTTESDRLIALYQRQLQRKPYDTGAYHRLGDAYIQKTRESGDVAYFDLAEQALKKALALAPKNAGAARHLAYVFYLRHDFDGAARQALAAVDLDPDDSHAYGVLGDAYLETGKYAEAEAVYRKMIALENDLSAYSRLAGLKSMRGDFAGAIADLELAVKDGRSAAAPAESVAWAEWQLGNEYFMAGKLPEAEARYSAALNTYPNYFRAFAGLAQVRTAQARYAEAVDLYQKALTIIPMPEYAAALGDLYAKTGRVEEARRQYALVEYIGRLNALNSILYNRELAYFYADHDIKPQDGLDLARREVEYRGDIYAYDVLAWNLYRNGKPEEARSAIDEALKLGTKDAKLFFHAGMIYGRLGEKDKARDYLGRALAVNPHFHVFFADEAARTLADIERQSDGG